MSERESEHVSRCFIGMGVGAFTCITGSKAFLNCLEPQSEASKPFLVPDTTQDRLFKLGHTSEVGQA